MTKDVIDFQRIRHRVPLKAFLESLGCILQEEGDTYRLACPLHNEKHGASFIIYRDQHWFCHGRCISKFERGGDVVDLAGALWGLENKREVVARLSDGEIPQIRSPETPAERLLAPLRSPKWPPRELQEIDSLVREGRGLYDAWEGSPCRFDDEFSHAEEIIDTLFPGNPLLCVGGANEAFATRRREVWRGNLSRHPLIVPNPMLRPFGRTKAGKISQHSLEATAGRVYLVIELDFARFRNDGTPTEFLDLIETWTQEKISVQDACCAILWRLAKRLPLVLIVHSGGKSCHGWFLAYGRDDHSVLLPFMQRAHQLGADPVTWRRSQFVRMPDGTRQSGERQTTFHFNPKNAVGHAR
jgi:hypothetical protein